MGTEITGTPNPFLDTDNWQGVDDEPVIGSENLVKSGGVAEELALGAVYDVSAKNPTAGTNNDGKWESLSALLSDANLNTLIPTSVRRGGMSIKFVQNSDNKYVQYRLMNTSFSTTESDWQGVDSEIIVGSHNFVEGSEVAGVKCSIDEMNTYCKKSVNLFNRNDVRNIEGAYLFVDSDNTVKFATYSYYRISHPILVEKGVSYKYIQNTSLGENNRIVAVCDINGNIINTKYFSGVKDGIYNVFTPDYTCFVLINLGIVNLTTTEFVISKADTYPSSYVPFYIESELKLQESEKNDIINQASNNALEQVDEDYFAISNNVNLFNKDSVDIISGKYLAYVGNPTHATLNPANNYRVTHVMHFKANLTYKAPAPSGVSDAYTIAAFVDYNGDLTGEFQSATIIEGFQYYTFNRDRDARINIGTSSIDTFMVCESSEYPEEYVPYYYAEYLNERYSLNNTQMQQVRDLAVENKLKSKLISLNGDSICWGNGYLGGYGKMIAEENNMLYENIAVGGATITSGTTGSGGGNRHWICDTVQNMNQNADYAIFEGGVNDAALYITPDSGFVLGTLSSGYTATLDKTTFYGAMETLCKTALNYFDHAKIGFVVVHKMTPAYISPNGVIYEATIKCLEKWGIPYINLNIECPPLAYIDGLKNAYTTAGDGWHPNEAGYRRFYVPKIASWLETL